jgi:hypothetical protein
MKQTAVEWLWNTLGDKGYFKKLPVSEFKEAKAMEKEQIVNAYKSAQFNIYAKDNLILGDSMIIKNGEEYYNETYNK